MGGGVRVRVYTRWPGLHAGALDDGDLTVTTGCRDVLAEIPDGRLGNEALERVVLDYTLTLGDVLVARPTAVRISRGRPPRRPLTP